MLLLLFKPLLKRSGVGRTICRWFQKVKEFDQGRKVIANVCVGIILLLIKKSPRFAPSGDGPRQNVSVRKASTSGRQSSLSGVGVRR